MTATTTYLQIVNSSINESGADSATFAVDGSDFTTRTDKYMNQFKTWVSRAWRDIQIECYDWDFMQEQGLCTLAPGIMFYTDGTAASNFVSYLPGGSFNIYDQSGSVAIPNVSITGAKDLTGTYTLTSPFFAADLGGYSAQTPLNIALKPAAEYINVTTVSAVFSPSSTHGTIPTVPFIVTQSGGNQLSPGTPDTIYVTSFPFPQTDLTLALTYDGAFTSSNVTLGATTTFSTLDGGFTIICDPQTVSTTPVFSGKCFVHSWRSYDFNEEVQVGDFQENIEEINQKSFRSIDYLQSPPAGEIPIPFMPWETFRSSYDISSSYPGTPRLITEDDTGRYRFFPALYYPYSIKFDYSRRPQILSAFGDIPRGINDEFTDLIMWRAINYYGEYMEQPSIIARSERRYKDLLSRLEQKNREMFHFKPAKLW